MRDDWIDIELGKISQIYNGNSVNEEVKDKKYRICKEGLNYIGTKDIGFDGAINYDNGVKIPFEEPKFKIAPKNCILVCSEGGSAGKKTAYTQENICFGNKLYAIVNKFSVFYGKYVYYYTRYWKFFQSFQNQMNGIIGGVSVKNFSNIEISIAPLLEQKAIVAKIEQLFSELDNGIANLKTAQAKLKIYRQAVLRKAFEGELTSEWREKQTNLPTADELLEQIKKEREEHYKLQLEEWKQAVKDWETNGKSSKKPIKPNQQSALKSISSSDLPNIPHCWLYFLSVDVSDFITKGTTPSKLELFSATGDIPFLKVYNLTFDASLDFKNNPTFVTNSTHQNFLKRSIVYPNDVLMNIVGPPLGKVSIVSDLYPEWNINQAIVRFRPYKILSSKYLAYYLLAHKTMLRISKKAKATVGQFNLTLEICREIELSLCSLEEQNQIVQEIESRLSVCDTIEETIKLSLQKAESLRQSILKKAFEGRLLSNQELEDIKNHPDYESAAKLLERIKQERK